jgi:hypothetical protein
VPAKCADFYPLLPGECFKKTRNLIFQGAELIGLSGLTLAHNFV